MPETKNKRKKYRSIFNTIVNRYHYELSNQVASVDGLYSKLSEDHSHNSYNPRVVKPSGSDFICDVELLGRRVLDDKPFYLFKYWYLDQNEAYRLQVFGSLSKMDYMDLNLMVQEVAGKEFKRCKLYPLKEYFKPLLIEFEKEEPTETELE